MHMLVVVWAEVMFEGEGEGDVWNELFTVYTLWGSWCYYHGWIVYKWKQARARL